MDNLKVFHRCLSNSAMKIQHIWLSLLIPAGWFIDKGDKILFVSILISGEQRLQLLGHAKEISFSLYI